MTKMQAYTAFADADAAWSAELQRQFGKRAGDARYMKIGRGEEGSELRRLHDARTVAMATWEAMGRFEPIASPSRPRRAWRKSNGAPSKSWLNVPSRGAAAWRNR